MIVINSTIWTCLLSNDDWKIADELITVSTRSIFKIMLWVYLHIKSNSILLQFIWSNCSFINIIFIWSLINLLKSESCNLQEWKDQNSFFAAKHFHCLLVNDLLYHNFDQMFILGMTVMIVVFRLESLSGFRTLDTLVIQQVLSIAMLQVIEE